MRYTTPVSAMDIAETGNPGSAGSVDKARGATLLERKSVLIGIAASMGIAFVNTEWPSGAAAGTVKPIAATQPTYAPRWTPKTAYVLGQQVISPNNDVVSAKVDHTSSTAIVTDQAKWALSSSYALSQVAGVHPLTGRVHVAAFGAVGDGVTDDTAAIQAALDY